MSLLCVGLLCLTACRPSADETDALGQYLMQSLIFARQNADTAMIEQIFRPDATYDAYPDQITYRGIDEIVAYVMSVHEWGDDVYLNPGNVQTSATGAVGEWFLAAVQNRPVPDVTTRRTGTEVVLSGVTIIEMEGGLISRAADYFDRTAMLLQLGGRVEMPDGTVISSDGTVVGSGAGG